MPHASVSASEAGLPLARFLLWSGICVAAFALISGVGTAFVYGGDRLTPMIMLPFVFFMLAIFTIYPIMFGAFRLSAEKRMRTVAALHPDAYLLHVVIRPKIASQLRAAAAALGVTATSIPWNNYAVFAADPQHLSLYAGSGTPRVSLPTSALAQATFQPVTVGVRTLTEFILGFADKSGQLHAVELLPVRWPGVLMRSMPAADFAAEFAAMQAATHPGA